MLSGGSRKAKSEEGGLKIKTLELRWLCVGAKQHHHHSVEEDGVVGIAAADGKLSTLFWSNYVQRDLKNSRLSHCSD